MKRIHIVLLLLVTSVVSAQWAEGQTQRQPSIISFDAPGAGGEPFQGTYPYGINAVGLITGWYLDGNNQARGFLRVPDGTITSFSVPNAGTGPFLGTGPWSINPEGATAGYYADENCV